MTGPLTWPLPSGRIPDTALLGFLHHRTFHRVFPFLVYLPGFPTKAMGVGFTAGLHSEAGSLQVPVKICYTNTRQ